MFSPIFFIAVVLIFAFVQISIFRALPEFVRRVLAYWPLLAIFINFFGSFVILFFVGVAHGFGVMNMFSSVIFGAYIIGYKKYKGIYKESRPGWRFPTLRAQNPEGTWLF